MIFFFFFRKIRPREGEYDKNKVIAKSGSAQRNNNVQNTVSDRKRSSVPRIERRMRLTGLVVGGRGRAHLAAHASGRYKRGLRANASSVHWWHVMVSTAADAATVMVSQSGPAGRTLHGHQFGRRYGDQAVAAVCAVGLSHQSDIGRYR